MDGSTTAAENPQCNLIFPPNAGPGTEPRPGSEDGLFCLLAASGGGAAGGADLAALARRQAQVGVRADGGDDVLASVLRGRGLDLGEHVLVEQWRGVERPLANAASICRQVLSDNLHMLRQIYKILKQCSAFL